MANDHIADDRKKVRLIDANRLLRDPYFQEDRYPCSHLIRMAVGEQRTVDAVEVVHGRWVDAYGIRKSKCTSCGVAFGRVMDADCYYCPNCGAKMDGERRTDES